MIPGKFSWSEGLIYTKFEEVISEMPYLIPV